MSRGKWLLFTIPLIAFGFLAFFFLQALNSDPTLLPSTRVDQKVPAFELALLSEPAEMVSQADLEGPLLLNVWATWCPSCKIEHPLLNELAKGGINIVGLNYKDDRNKAVGWLNELGNPYLISLFDGNGMLGLDLGVYGAPETFLIDANGIVRYRHVGDVNPTNWASTLEPMYQELLEEAK